MTDEYTAKYTVELAYKPDMFWRYTAWVSGPDFRRQLVTGWTEKGTRRKVVRMLRRHQELQARKDTYEVVV